MDHHVAGAPSAGALRQPGGRARGHRAGRDPHLHRRRLGARGVRAPRAHQRPASGLHLRLQRAARRRPAGLGRLPHRADRAQAVHLHQLRRPGHPRQAPGRRPPAAVHLGRGNLATPGGGRHRRRRRAGRAAVPPAQRRPLLRQPGPGPGAHLGRRSSQNNTRSARFRPWMPAAGNHENEKGNGPIGYGAFQTYFALPPNGEDAESAGLWYAFTVGSVRFVVLQNDDVCLQDGGDTYVSGYSRRPAEAPGWSGAEGGPRATAASTGSSSACTRSRSPAPTPTAPTSASARSGSRCSTSTGRPGRLRARAPLRALAPDPRRSPAARP